MRIFKIQVLVFLLPTMLFGMRPSSKQFPFGQDVFRTSQHNGVGCVTFSTHASSSYEAFDGRETFVNPWGGYNLKDVIASQKIVYEAEHGAGTYVNPLEIAKGSNIWNNQDINYLVNADSYVSGFVVSYYHLFENVVQAASRALLGPAERQSPIMRAARNFFDQTQVYVGADLPIMSGTASASYRIDPALTRQLIRTLSQSDIDLIDGVRRRLQQDDLGIHANSWSANGIGDLDVYIGFGRVFDHRLRFRTIDLSVVFGMTVPIGRKRELNNPLSIPFGFEDVTYHADFLAEFELKQGWRAGCAFGLNSGCSSNVERRVPVMNEVAELSPLIFCPDVKTGMTISASPYFTLENIQPGLHATLRYRYVEHMEDDWRDNRENPAVASFLTRSSSSEFHQADIEAIFYKYTAWTSKHVNFTATYDPGQRDGKWIKRPLFWFAYDYPLDVGTSTTLLRNRRVSFGVTLRF